jgi:hypothetical protein
MDLALQIMYLILTYAPDQSATLHHASLAFTSSVVN